MRLLAISDLHVGYARNRQAVAELNADPVDWLILGGDLGETPEHLLLVLRTLRPRFAKLLWVPGNHDLWTLPQDPCQKAGVDRYEHLVAICRSEGVLTPEDEWPIWPGDGPPTRICLMFLLYDYSFAPDGVTDPIAWAAEKGIRALDERHLGTAPFPTLPAWCAARLEATRARLARVSPAERLVLVNHWPLRRDLVRLALIPRFTVWCGTRATEDWHRHYPVDVVVHGHLHVRATDWRDGVRFEEVSLGGPSHWDPALPPSSYLRQILPRTAPPAT